MTSKGRWSEFTRLSSRRINGILMQLYKVHWMKRLDSASSFNWRDRILIEQIIYLFLLYFISDESKLF